MGCTFVLKYSKSRDDDEETGCCASNATNGTKAMMDIKAVLLKSTIRTFVIYHGPSRNCACQNEILRRFSLKAIQEICRYVVAETTGVFDGVTGIMGRRTADSLPWPGPALLASVVPECSSTGLLLRARASATLPFDRPGSR